jgi:hypothetical protein
MRAVAARITTWATKARERCEQSVAPCGDPEAGYTTETIVLTFGLLALAIAVSIAITVLVHSYMAQL